jgi:hypothetical protein
LYVALESPKDHDILKQNETFIGLILIFAGFLALPWINAVILAAFAIAFGWFYFRK